MYKLAALALASLALAACNSSGLPSGTASTTSAAAVSFDACRPCHAAPAAGSALFDPAAPEPYRAAVGRVLTDDAATHPYKPSPAEWDALMAWSNEER